MAKRGVVLVVPRRLGFGADGRREHFVVLQSDLLQGLDTVVVAPLDQAAAMYDGDPLVVPLTPKESGTKAAQVALVYLLSAVPVARFEEAAVGRVSARTLARLGEATRTVLDL